MRQPQYLIGDATRVEYTAPCNSADMYRWGGAGLTSRHGLMNAPCCPDAEATARDVDRGAIAFYR